MHAPGRALLRLSVQVAQMLAESVLATQTRPSANTLLTQPVTLTTASRHEINDQVIIPNQMNPPHMSDFRQQLDVGNLGSPNDSW